MQIKTTSHLFEQLFFKRQEIQIGKDEKKREPLCAFDSNANW